MAVYVDDSRIRWRGGLWSHLLADTTEELHYDIPEAKRQVAIGRGARPITCREAAELLRARRLAFKEAARARHAP